MSAVKGDWEIDVGITVIIVATAVGFTILFVVLALT